MLAQIGAHRRHLDGCAKLLASLGYQGVLQRGYALVRDSEGRTLRSAAQIAAGQLLDIELADGHVDARRSVAAAHRVVQSRSPRRDRAFRRARPAIARRRPGLAVLMRRQGPAHWRGCKRYLYARAGFSAGGLQAE